MVYYPYEGPHKVLEEEFELEVEEGTLVHEMHLDWLYGFNYNK